jgi:hypothetical protein
VGYGVLYSCVQSTQSHPHLAPNPEAHEYTYLSVPRVIKRNQEGTRGNKRGHRLGQHRNIAAVQRRRAHHHTMLNVPGQYCTGSGAQGHGPCSP